LAQVGAGIDAAPPPGNRMLYRLPRALLCSTVLLLGACGIKGPLYLPAPVAQPVAPAAQSAPLQPAADGSKSPATATP